MSPAVILIAAASLTADAAFAHDSISEQIAVVTVLIHQNADDPDLLVRRAQLYRENRQWAESLADFERATHLEPTLPAREIGRAQLFLDWGRWLDAEDAATTFLARQPSQPVALVIRGRARARLGRAQNAVDDFSLSLATHPLPDLYIERARLLGTLGGDGPARAVRSLDEGIARLGAIATLELEAIDLEVGLHRFDAALARLDRVAAQVSRQESWLARRGAVLEAAARGDAALAQYRQALALTGVQSGGRQTRATAALATQLRADIRRLEARTVRNPFPHR